MVRRTANVAHVVVAEPVGKITRDVAGTIVGATLACERHPPGRSLTLAARTDSQPDQVEEVREQLANLLGEVPITRKGKTLVANVRLESVELTPQTAPEKQKPANNGPLHIQLVAGA